jgi:hypothetical protein
MYIYDEYEKQKHSFTSVNDFLLKIRIRDTVDFFKNSVIGNTSVKKVIHYRYYKHFSVNMIDILQCFLPNTKYIPPYRLLLCKTSYEQYVLYQYGWKAVIQSFLETVYSEECFRDDFYYQNPDFDWVSYAIYHNLTTYHESIIHYKNNNNNKYNEQLYSKIPYLIFDDWFESTFSSKTDERVFKKKYKYPFISFIHNTPLSCIKYDEFLQFKDNIKLILTFSSYNTNYYKDILNQDASFNIRTVCHPVKINNQHEFDISNFLQLLDKKVIYINSTQHTYNIFSIQHFNISFVIGKDITDLFVDYFFKTHIVLLDGYDDITNNIILNCIMCNTPILVKPIPSIVEYLGINYPFYYTNMSDVSYKIESIDIILKTHHYLKNMDKSRFTYEYFHGAIKHGIHDILSGN